MTEQIDFDSMTREQKAVAVAKDVLEHLDMLNMTRGEYFAGRVILPEHLIGKIDASTPLQELCDAATKDCRVCAIGACFISHVRLFDRVDLGYVVGGFQLQYRQPDSDALPINMSDTKMRNHLNDYFGRENLNLIESAFECSVGYSVGNPLATAAEDFGQRYVSSVDRMRAIMENVIANNGVFNPVSEETESNAQEA